MKQVLIILTFLFCGGISGVCAEYSKSDIEAAFIYKFAYFVTLPNSSDLKVIRFCVNSDKKLLRSLKQLEDKKINSSSLEILDFKKSKNHHCHFLVSDKVVKNSKRGYGFLITRNSKIFSNSMILLKVENNKIIFDINYKNITTSGYKVSSKLISLANRVVR